MQQDEPVVLEDPVIKEIAEKHTATPAQVIISDMAHNFHTIITHSLSLSLLLSLAHSHTHMHSHTGVFILPTSPRCGSHSQVCESKKDC